MIMKPSFAHRKYIKKHGKWTYTQSYPQFPQKMVETTVENGMKNRIYVSCKLLKKTILPKELTNQMSNNVEKLNGIDRYFGRTTSKIQKNIIVLH